MTEINGAQHPVDLDEQTQSELARLANKGSLQVQESLTPSMLPFDQRAHDLLIESIDQVATDWVGELEHVRDNSKKVEQLVMERAAKVKADITALYLLGSAALAEAKRGDEVNTRLGNELEKLAEERTAS
jgi:hypothetical protein